MRCHRLGRGHRPGGNGGKHQRPGDKHNGSSGATGGVSSKNEYHREYTLIVVYRRIEISRR
jgi:hypothetical protein